MEDVSPVRNGTISTDYRTISTDYRNDNDYRTISTDKVPESESKGTDK